MAVTMERAKNLVGLTNFVETARREGKQRLAKKLLNLIPTQLV